MRSLPPFFVMLVLIGSSAGPARAQPAPPSAPSPKLSDEAELARVVSQYEAGRYQECAASLEPLLAPGPRQLQSPSVLESARVVLAACLLGDGRGADAEAQLAQALRANPRMPRPDPLAYPQPVVDLWIRVRESLREELRAAEEERLKLADAAAQQQARVEAEQRARLLRLEQLASEEQVTQVNRRWIAAIPFGVGQFQNGHATLGWTFFGVEVALGAVSLGALAVHLSAYRQIAAGHRLDPIVTNSQLSTSFAVLQVSSWTLLGTAALGVLDAQLRFVPEVRQVRRRPLPEELRRPSALRTAPMAAALPGGAWLGLAGTY